MRGLRWEVRFHFEELDVEFEFGHVPVLKKFLECHSSFAHDDPKGWAAIKQDVVVSSDLV